MYLFQGTEEQRAGCWVRGAGGGGGAATAGGLCRQGDQEGPGQHSLLTLCDCDDLPVTCFMPGTSVTLQICTGFLHPHFRA